MKGWRDEVVYIFLIKEYHFYSVSFQCYEVKTEFNSSSLLKMDRSATCLFGIRNYGVDINGYVRHPDKGLCLWFQKRSATKQTWPGNS